MEEEEGQVRAGDINIKGIFDCMNGVIEVRGGSAEIEECVVQDG